jgi:hypothetical protein
MQARSLSSFSQKPAPGRQSQLPPAQPNTWKSLVLRVNEALLIGAPRSRSKSAWIREA